MNATLQLWAEVFLNPLNAFKAESKQASVIEGLKNLFFAYAAAFLLGLVVFSSGLSASTFLSFATSLFSAIILFLFVSIMFHCCAKLLGGKGRFDKFFSILTLAYAPLIGILTVFQSIKTSYYISSYYPPGIFSFFHYAFPFNSDLISFFWNFMGITEE